MLWEQSRVGSTPTSGTMAYYRKPELNQDKELQAYVIGLAIGDGNLSNSNGRATRLRVTCDPKYPNLIQRISAALRSLLPQNKVSIIKRKDAIDVAVCSNHLEDVLGWRANGGPKFVQRVTILSWIKKEKNCKIACLRGLIETDGSIYVDRGYKMVIFKSVIPDLAQEVFNTMSSLGFGPHLYKLSPPKKKPKYNQQTAYHVRLSKNVQKFLDLVKPDKS